MLLSRQDQRVWFFTNEKIACFLNNLPLEIKRVFAIAGSGDLGYNFLSLFCLNELNLCDNRPMATATVDFKNALFRQYDFAEIRSIFNGKRLKNAKEIYQKIRNALAPRTIVSYDNIFRGASAVDFIDALKKSKKFYNESFGYLKSVPDYLPYLQSEEKYEAMRIQLNKIKIFNSDFSDILSQAPAQYYSLVYTSNILDDKRYSADNLQCLNAIKRKLVKQGFVLAAIQDKVKKQVNFFEQNGFQLIKLELNKFNFISSLKGHYYFSFALFQNCQ